MLKRIVIVFLILFISCKKEPPDSDGDGIIDSEDQCPELVGNAAYQGCPAYTLTVNVNPSEGGTVSPSTSQYKHGTNVSLSATPSSEFLFDNWSGDVSGSATTISLIINSNKTITANFSKIKYPLTIEVEGKGTVETEVIQPGLATDYNSGTILQLTAIPNNNEWVFEKWSGDVESNENPIKITIDSPKNIIANFNSKFTWDYVRPDSDIDVDISYSFLGTHSITAYENKIYYNALIPASKNSALSMWYLIEYDNYNKKTIFGPLQNGIRTDNTTPQGFLFSAYAHKPSKHIYLLGEDIIQDNNGNFIRAEPFLKRKYLPDDNSDFVEINLPDQPVAGSNVAGIPILSEYWQFHIDNTSTMYLWGHLGNRGSYILKKSSSDTSWTNIFLPHSINGHYIRNITSSDNGTIYVSTVYGNSEIRIYKKNPGDDWEIIYSENINGEPDVFSREYVAVDSENYVYVMRGKSSSSPSYNKLEDNYVIRIKDENNPDYINGWKRVINQNIENISGNLSIDIRDFREVFIVDDVIYLHATDESGYDYILYADIDKAIN